MNKINEKINNELIEVKDNNTKLKEENNELNKKISEYNEKLENIMNENKNLIEELNQKKEEIEKLTKEINEKDRLYKLLKTENITKLKEYEISFKNYKEELNEKNKIIKELKSEKEDKEKIIIELNNKIKEKDDIMNEDKKQLDSKCNNNNKIEKEKILIESEESEKKVKDVEVNYKEKIINKENKKEEKEEKEEKENKETNVKKEERRYMYSLRNRFLRKKEEEKKKKEMEEKNNNAEENNCENKLNSLEIKAENNDNKEQKHLNESEEKKQETINHGNKLEEEKDEVKESIRKMNRKKNYTHKPRFEVKNKDLPIIEEPQKALELDSNDVKESQIINNDQTNYFLYGIDRNDYFHIFDVTNKKYEKMEISKINLDEKSISFKKDYQYDGTILYNTLKGIYILTGEKTDILYYFNSENKTISKICKFNSGHDNGSILYDDKNNTLYVFGGKKIKFCEYFNFNEKKLYKMPDLTIDRANASFIISNNKIFGFFGFSYEKNNYANSIEYIDYTTKEKWIEINDINLLQKDITFDVESMATLYYKNNENEILIYCGIKGDDEDFITDYYLIYNVKNNSMDKIKAWEIKQFKSYGKKWKNYFLKKTDPKGFHFAKNTRFLNTNNNNEDNLNYLIDYKNNIHIIDQDNEKIEIYRGNI